MSKRLDQERQQQLEPKRVKECLKKLRDSNINAELINDKAIKINHNNKQITFYPYSGWHTGKGIKDGRGFSKLLKQLR